MSNRPIRFAVCGLMAPITLAVLSGCYSYNPYGHGGYPEVLSTVPAPVISPAGRPLPPGVIPIGPQAATPTGTVGPLLMPPTLATPPPAGTPGITQPVPRYQDPTDSAAGPESTNAGDGAAESSSLRIPADGTLTGGTGEAAGDVIQANGETKVKTPATVTVPASARPIDPAPTTVPAINESNYGYDTAGYKWFKGVVEYDKTDGAWHLMYAPTPSQNDPYGGDISLANDPRLDAVQNNDVIYVTGTLESGLTDRVGKPRFQVDQLSNITAEK